MGNILLHNAEKEESRSDMEFGFCKARSNVEVVNMVTGLAEAAREDVKNAVKAAEEEENHSGFSQITDPKMHCCRNQPGEKVDLQLGR